jgi:hypothetical protein
VGRERVIGAIKPPPEGSAKQREMCVKQATTPVLAKISSRGFGKNRVPSRKRAAEEVPDNKPIGPC